MSTSDVILADEREHLLDALAELIAARGWQQFVLAPVVLPTARFFPDRWSPDSAGVWCVAKRLLRYAGLDALELQLEMFDDAAAVARDSGGLVHATAHTSAAAWFAGIDNGVCYFGANTTELDDGLGVAASMAHESAHAYRHAHRLEIDDRDVEEQLTDLTAVYLGFGILVANAASRHRSWNPAGDVFASAHTYRSLGYLSPPALCFLLACQAAVRGVDPAATRALETNQASYFRRAQAWFERELPDVATRLGIPPRSEWPRPVALESLLGPIEVPAEKTDPDLVPVAPETAVSTASRVPRSRALGFGVIGAMLGISGPVLAFGFDALILSTVVAATAGAWLGHRRPAWYCSRCDARVSAKDPSCRACGSRITHALRRAEDRLRDDAEVDGEPEVAAFDASDFDGSALPREHGVLCISLERERTGRFEIERVQRQHELVFPPSYADYLETLGAGIDSGVVEIWSPERIALERRKALEWIGRHTWDAQDALVDLDPNALVLIATTCDGDRLALHPHHPKHVLWLRDDVHEMVDLGTDFHAALDEICDLADDEARWFAPTSMTTRATFHHAPGITMSAIVERILGFGRVRVQPERFEDGAEAWLVLVPAIGGTVRLHATPDRGWDVEIASDAANVDTARRLAAALEI